MSVDLPKSGKTGSGVVPKAAIGDEEYTLASLANTLGFLTRVVQVQMMDRVRASGGVGMSMATFSLLVLVNANPGIRQAHAARILLIQESNMVNLIKNTMEQGFIERRGDGGKRAGLWVTDKGKERLVSKASQDALDRSYAAVLSDKEYKQLIGLLNRVYRAWL